MFKLIIILAFFFALTHCELRIPKHVKPLSQEMIDRINSMNTTWKAGKNFEGVPLKYVKRLLIKRHESSLDKLEKKIHSDIDIPEYFDAREKWPHCKSIKKIYDQGGCTASWVFGAIGTMNDRICIASNGNLNVELSAQDALTCCYNCANKCLYGVPINAWYFWNSHGIVTGGDYNSSIGCKPYTLAPCKHYSNVALNPCKYQRIPPCVYKCRDGYNISFRQDRYFGKVPYTTPIDENQIKAEILKHGPVNVAFLTYLDFFSYKSGVYQHKSDKSDGFLSARLIGWGVENELPYWLLANSWNTDWGDKGYFKVIRGTKDYAIETFVKAALPELDRESL